MTIWRECSAVLRTRTAPHWSQQPVISLKDHVLADHCNKIWQNDPSPLSLARPGWIIDETPTARRCCSDTNYRVEPAGADAFSGAPSNSLSVFIPGFFFFFLGGGGFPPKKLTIPPTAAKLCALNLFYAWDNKLQIGLYDGNFLLMDNKHRK